MSSVSVSLASEAEAPACLALLPQARQMSGELLIARRDGRLAGAAAVAWRSWATPGGFPLTLTVIPGERRAGVGRRLAAQAIELARGETAGLWSLEPEAVGGPAAAFLEACGFALTRRQHHFQASIAALSATVRPLVTRLRQRGRVPEDVRVVTLAQAPLPEISWLVSTEFGGGPFRALANLQRRASQGPAAEADPSVVILQGDQVAAVMLLRIEDGVAAIDARVVAPQARGAWANAMLLDESLERTRALGIGEFRFHCDEDVADTLSLARRCGAREVSEKGLYYYAFNGA